MSKILKNSQKSSFKSFPKEVKIVEVGPRDGLQNEKKVIPTETKIDFINRLSKTGLKNIEVTSFVSAKRIPQLADSQTVFAGIQKNPNICYSVLVPNTRGMETALSLDAKHIAVFTTVSETFSQKNTHCSVAESLERIADIMLLAKQKSIPVRAYISCVLGCPYEGEVSITSVAKLAKELIHMGCYEISLGDTIGVGTPGKSQDLITAVMHEVPVQQLAVHFHDTYGQALANIFACLELGVSVIDSSIAGLGGCPYAFGASGNVATEDVLYMLQGLGIKTGIDMNALIDVSRFVSEFTGRAPQSKVAIAKLGSSDIAP